MGVLETDFSQFSVLVFGEQIVIGYAARKCVTSFGESIRAENRSNWFAIVLKLVPESPIGVMNLPPQLVD